MSDAFNPTSRRASNALQPTTRAVAWLVFLFSILTVAWSLVAQTEIVATAHGKIVPSERTKEIRAPGNAIVEDLFVLEGDVVERGQLLISFDSSALAADKRRIVAELDAANLDHARLRALLADEPMEAYEPPTKAHRDDISIHLHLLRADWHAHRSELEAVRGEIDRERAGIATLRGEAGRDEEILELMQDRLARSERLAANGWTSAFQIIELRQALAKTAGDIRTYANRINEARSEVNRLEATLRMKDDQFRRERLEQLAVARERAATLREQLARTDWEIDRLQVHAPIAGTVQELRVLTKDSVVEHAEDLMLLVPDVGDLEVEARILNKDIGFITLGQQVHVKLEAFPFTRYGRIEGQVIDLSPDILSRTRTTPAVNVTTDVSEREARVAYQSAMQGSLYLARIRLEKNALLVDGAPVDLLPGMTAVVDIVTGKRRIADYILSPLLRYAGETFTER